jgi:sugar phosphate isomerase/epimerase
MIARRRSGQALSRRTFLTVAGIAPFAASAMASMQKSVPVGLELYSVRGELMKDLPGTVTAVAKLGYQVVEFYAPYFEWTPAAAKDVRKLLDDLGIQCRSTHNGPPSFTPEGLKKAIELNQIIGSKNIIMSSAGRVDGIAGWEQLAARMTEVASQLRPLRMSTGFHNHQTEWKEVEGKRPMDVLAAGTPKDFVLQFDVGTCLEAGVDPIGWIKSNPGRIRSMHCKDWSKDKGYAVAFGEGDAPWKQIFAAAEAGGGIEYYLIEQEIAGPEGEFAMAQRCLGNYRKLRA